MSVAKVSLTHVHIWCLFIGSKDGSRLLRCHKRVLLPNVPLASQLISPFFNKSSFGSVILESHMIQKLTLHLWLFMIHGSDASETLWSFRIYDTLQILSFPNGINLRRYRIGWYPRSRLVNSDYRGRRDHDPLLMDREN